MLVAAPSCLLLESLLSPLTSSSTAADVRAISAHESRFVVSVILGVVGTLVLLPALWGLLSRTVERAPVISRLAAALVAVGLPAWVAMRMGSAVELQGIRDRLGVGTTAHLLDHLEANPIAAVIVSLFLLGTLIGTLATGVAGWRAGYPRPAAVLVMLFPVADMALDGVAPEWLAFLVLAVGLIWIATATERPPASAEEALAVAHDVPEHAVDESR
jgi:hypothetical protein